MEQDKPTLPRKKFIAWGLAIASFFTLPSFFKKQVKTTGGNSQTFLTQEGKLVEVDEAHFSKKIKKAKDKDIQNWMRKDPYSH